MADPVLDVLRSHKIVGCHDKAAFGVVETGVLLWGDEAFPQVVLQPSLLRVNALTDIELPLWK